MIGREAIRHHLVELFEAWRIERISPVHEEFEPDRRCAHEWGEVVEAVRPVDGGEAVEVATGYLAVFERQPDRPWELARLAEVPAGPAEDTGPEGSAHGASGGIIGRRAPGAGAAGDGWSARSGIPR